MLTDRFRQFCEDEYTDYQLYIELAKREKDAGRMEILEGLSKAEKRHTYSGAGSLADTHLK